MKMKKSNITRRLLMVLAPFSIFACGPATERDDRAAERVISRVNNPEWSINANIYEVNTRQFSPEGTFAAFEEHLDRLQEMGVDILWFMPIQPIGEKNRKGTLGSYYSIANYTAINPEFGTMADFKRVVDGAHERGMYVILDWVANHTAWDHYWTETNPEFYELDADGNFMPPNEDWTDVLQLDYSNEALRTAMIGEMRFWIEEIGLDGFRCDVADYVPTDFWVRARTELESIKPVFMLAEAENPELHEYAFEAGYGWRLHHIMNDIAAGDKNVKAIDNYFFVEDAGGFPYGSYKMYFITNHDENSWAGTEFDRLGDGVEAFAVFTATIPGTILLYNGQEAGFDRMLEFFEKDQIDWGDFKYHDFYKTLLGLKRENRALWNGAFGGEMVRVPTNHDRQVFAFVREKEEDKVFVVLNLSDKPLDVRFKGELFPGSYTELFSEEAVDFDRELRMQLEPWAYRVYFR
ncbi:MAG: alpha-amylase [Bacteroidia bacterium]|nr:MAG: alpha-amylase [Bacteroidia bacterium]